MRVSIKIKLVSIFVAFFLLTTGITAFIMDYLLDDAIIDDKARSISENTRTIVSYISKITAEDQFVFLEYYLNLYRQSINAVIMIGDIEGNIIMSVPSLDSMPSIMNKLSRVSANKYKFSLKEQFEIIPPEEEVRRETGYFFGLLDGINEENVPWLTVRNTITVDNSVIGTLYVFSPTPEILKIKNGFYKVFVTAALIAIFLTTILIYFYSRWFIKPITVLNQASREVAKGNYKEIIKTKSRDEIGDLTDNFNEMTKNLERLENSRRDFIANASHELRSPMTSIKGFIDAILDGVVPEDKTKEYLTVIKSEINRLSLLVTKLLDIAKFESEELQLNKAVFDINSLLRRTIAKFEPSIIDKKLFVHANYQEKVLLVEADEEMIERVCVNLIQNSLKYTSDNGDMYIVTKKKKNKVFVSIIDNGQGINLDEINLIWDRFYKTDTSRGVDKVGVGLGLSIVKKILDAHGEMIAVSSEPNVKTEFTFSLNAKG